MENPYQTLKGANSYLDFINSKDGFILQSVLSKNILNRLDIGKQTTILDAGCGNGWLTNFLKNHNFNVTGLDISKDLINLAQKNYPTIPFVCSDLNSQLPFSDSQFETTIFNLSLLDIQHLNNLSQEMRRIVKHKIILVSVNPYYGYPVGEWKRGFFSKIFKFYPKLKLNPYFNFINKNREFKWNNDQLTSYFYTLPEQINTFTKAGFKLAFIQDIKGEPSKNYDLNFRLSKFPIFILLEFVK